MNIKNIKRPFQITVCSALLITALKSYGQKQFELSINFGRSSAWAKPDPSPFLIFSRTNPAQYESYKLMYTVKPYFQTGLAYGTGFTALNFGFRHTDLNKPIIPGGTSSVQLGYNQVFIPLQFNLFTDYIFEPYIAIAPAFCSRQNYGEFIATGSEIGGDSILYDLKITSLPHSRSFGGISYAGVKFHIWKRFIIKLEGGYGFSARVFSKAVLNYSYNGVHYNDINFKFNKYFNYISLGVSYKFRLFHDSKKS
jgi:hypothetical protein